MVTRCPNLSQTSTQGGGFLEKPPKAKYFFKRFEKTLKWGSCYMKSCCLEIISSEHDQGLAQSSCFHLYSQNYLRHKTSFTKKYLEIVLFCFLMNKPT
jgi:hypothetical protein